MVGVVGEKATRDGGEAEARGRDGDKVKEGAREEEERVRDEDEDVEEEARRRRARRTWQKERREFAKSPEDCEGGELAGNDTSEGEEEGRSRMGGQG